MNEQQKATLAWYGNTYSVVFFCFFSDNLSGTVSFISIQIWQICFFFFYFIVIASEQVAGKKNINHHFLSTCVFIEITINKSFQIAYKLSIQKLEKSLNNKKLEFFFVETFPICSFILIFNSLCF